MLLTRFAKRQLGIDQKGSAVFRRQRFALVLELIDDVLRTNPICRIIDIGGESEYWSNVRDLLGDRACHITLVNLDAPAVHDPMFTSIAGDARHLGAFADMSFDLVHSNSVIEHVGRWADMSAMAREVRRLAPAYYVQTPNFWFPVEPHCSTAFFHWMPEQVRVSMLMKKPRGYWGQATDVDSAMAHIQSAELLDMRMMSALFSDAEMKRERFMGLTKSLIAVRRELPVGDAVPEHTLYRNEDDMWRLELS